MMMLHALLQSGLLMFFSFSHGGWLPHVCLPMLQVVYCMDRALVLAPACHRFKILKAECLALLGRYPEAQSVAMYYISQTLLYIKYCCGKTSHTKISEICKYHFRFELICCLNEIHYYQP